MRRHSVVCTVVLCGLAISAPVLAQAPTPLVYAQPLSPQSVQTIQDRLRQAGLYAGAVDGVWGADSASALQRFQQSHQLQVTGQMNQATAATLGMDPRALLEPTPAAQAVAPAPAQAASLSPGSIRTVQNRLRALNFYQGSADGMWGAATQHAIERFQQGRGLQPNGQLNPATVAALGLTPDVLTYR